MKCLIEGCENMSYTKGYCSKHYKRLLRHGNPSIKNKTGRKEGNKYPRNKLNEKELEVIYLYEKEKYTFEMIGKKLGVTRQRACQLYHDSKRRLKC